MKRIILAVAALAFFACGQAGHAKPIIDLSGRSSAQAQVGGSDTGKLSIVVDWPA